MMRDIRNTEFAIGKYGIFVNEKVRIKLNVPSLHVVGAGEQIAERFACAQPGQWLKW